MMDKHVYSGEWHIRLPDGERLNMNSEEAVDYLLGLLEHIGELEAQLKKRERRRAKAKRKEIEEEDGE